MFGKEPENQAVTAGQTSIIAQGCKFDGKVDVRGTLRIEGEYRGTIGLPESLVIGKTGVVHANCTVKNAIIGGQLFGNIDRREQDRAAERLARRRRHQDQASGDRRGRVLRGQLLDGLRPEEGPGRRRAAGRDRHVQRGGAAAQVAAPM